MKINGQLKWELVDGPDVPARLYADVDQALKRRKPVSIKAMYAALDNDTRPIVDLLVKAAEDRALAPAISFLADAYSTQYAETPDERKHISELKRAITLLGQRGAHARFTNTYAGPIHRIFFKEVLRDHRKGHTAGDIAWLGSANFAHKNFYEMADFMLRCQNDSLAQLLRTMFARDAEKRLPGPDKLIPLDQANVLLCDGGTPGRSLILDQTRKLVSASMPHTITYISQYPPAPSLARQLRHNPPVTAAFNTSGQLSKGQTLLKVLLKLEESLAPTIPGARHLAQYIHAKSMTLHVKPDSGRHIFPQHKGPIGIFGTHNFNWHGVLAGTHELALVTTDQDLIQQHRRWLISKKLLP